MGEGVRAFGLAGYLGRRDKDGLGVGLSSWWLTTEEGFSPQEKHEKNAYMQSFNYKAMVDKYIMGNRCEGSWCVGGNVRASGCLRKIEIIIFVC